MFNLTGKTAVITGGGSGIGKAIAILFAKQGANVAIIEWNQRNGEEVANLILQNGGKAACYVCDVSKQAEVKATYDTIYTQNGAFNILVNSAGISHIGNLEKTTE